MTERTSSAGAVDSRRRIVALVLFSFALLLHVDCATGDELSDARRKLYAAYGAHLATLSRECEQQGQPELADRLQTWLPNCPQDQICIFPYRNSTIDDAKSESSGTLGKQFNLLRQKMAAALFKLARRAAASGRATLAMTLVGEALHEDPDLAVARRLIGHEQFADAWHTADEVRRLKAGQVWHVKFGWLPADHVARYEAGQRNYKGRWMTAEQEAGIRGEIARGWEVETEHYAVTTNHSLEAAVRLASRLERLYDVWWQLFAGYHLSDDELKRMFTRGVLPRRTTKRHKVVYFRDRDEYVRTLSKIQPAIGSTLGIYFSDVRTAYFFAGDEQDPGTLHHEATHQLFQETRPTRATIGQRANFWIVEGVACYMESLEFVGDYARVGGLESGRLPAARVRLLKDGFYIPFDELVTLSSGQVQRHSNIRTLYSQFAGQAAFLMHYDAGRYRPALSVYLQDIYRGADRPNTLARLTNVEPVELDRQYREFLKGESGPDSK